MGNAPGRAEALHVFAAQVNGQGLGINQPSCGDAVAAFLEFPVEPKRRVQPEKRKRTDQQLDHHLVGDPYLRITVEVARISVRLKARESRWRVGQFFLSIVAFAARLHAIVGMHL